MDDGNWHRAAYGRHKEYRMRIVHYINLMRIRSFVHNNLKVFEIINIVFDLIGLILISWFLFEAKPIRIFYEETFTGIIGDFRPIINSINQLAFSTNLLIKMWIGFAILVINNALKLILLILKKI